MGMSPSDSQDSLSIYSTDAYLLQLFFERIRLKGAEAVARTVNGSTSACVKVTARVYDASDGAEDQRGGSIS